METKKEDIGEILVSHLKESSRKARKSPYLKNRLDIRCNCKRQTSNEKQRVKFGTCRCDSFSMSYTLAVVISNYLYQYLADAKNFIVREDWDIIEKHAKAIRDYAEADSWDTLDKDKKIVSTYKRKEKDFKESMSWMVKNWQSLWW